ncbi:hypothetical protein [Arthrobacter glacialis]|uniref:Uncharacterized protein n=1 Tax=Arthrobacter glacialis TaxID=1664 RepID=A0A2S3ZS88_ARTGL|nr:hypothetical protein [Arthrobacter glacialis]POH72126.1 hypothetical protein CVS27_17545 [Arthrobacter glacialis]
MSETALPQSAAANMSVANTPLLWRAVLLRALVTLAFGLTTVFWGAPGTLGLCLALGAYLLAAAAAQYLSVRTLSLTRNDARRLVLLGAAGLLAVSGVVVAISASTLVAAVLGGAALAVMGGAELFSALYRPAGTAHAKSALGNDWLISGVLGLGTGILLPFFAAAGPHALMGVAGGGALMTGALWVLSALTLRHDGYTAKGQ